ncbi:hypothetical protein BDM02DRAFT_3264624 [Thelephora ganbajun]|uniref:Uncharacterized protein n=2 Tax=Thelephora ganbajun TaxID=370292 RepID=A0ACB6YXC0_THEGA|nr:hypothetical protein BDM02DRAFT_3124974 [Thelephora ganbajun]KAF9641955.1 hypothetical protein BDM02DRAFT_3264624 [Thelephora ganbajun]
MHNCLKVDEILRLIACELVPPDIIGEAKGRATAVALACCRRSFEDPVLDALWESQYRLVPLLKTLPEDVWNEGKCTPFKRLPTKLELTRFRKYARRMREVTEYGPLEDGRLSSEVFLVLHRFTSSELLLPNLRTLWLSSVTVEFIPSILLLVSPGTTTIDIGFEEPDLSKALVASTITAFPTRCPNLQQIGLHCLPRDPMIIAAVSEFLLTTNRNTLRSFHVDSPLTEEAREVISKLPNLCNLMVAIERNASLPSLVLPNLRELTIAYDHDGNQFQMFRGATFEKLESVTFYFQSEQTGDFLGLFERVAIAASVQNTLSEFRLYTSCSWNPTYFSLLLFTQLRDLTIEFSCNGGCSSRVDDDIIINLARAMAKLESLRLGGDPCRSSPTGVTAKGLVALAHHCPNLFTLCVHFHAITLSVPPATVETASNADPTDLWRGGALRELAVGKIPVPDKSVSKVALTLARIFPHISLIRCVDANWGKVLEIIRLSRQIVNYSRAALESGS